MPVVLFLKYSIRPPPPPHTLSIFRVRVYACSLPLKAPSIWCDVNTGRFIFYLFIYLFYFFNIYIYIFFFWGGGITGPDFVAWKSHPLPEILGTRMRSRMRTSEWGGGGGGMYVTCKCSLFSKDDPRALGMGFGLFFESSGDRVISENNCISREHIVTSFTDWLIPPCIWIQTGGHVWNDRRGNTIG